MTSEDPYIDQLLASAQGYRRKAETLEFMAPRLKRLPDGMEYTSVTADPNGHAEGAIYMMAPDLKTALSLRLLYPPAPLVVTPGESNWYNPMTFQKGPGMRIQPVVYSVVRLAEARDEGYSSFVQWFTFLETRCFYVSVLMTERYSWREGGVVRGLPSGETVEFTDASYHSNCIFWHYMETRWAEWLTALEPIDLEAAGIENQQEGNTEWPSLLI
jgi:hypothetical protein